jgi:predicted nucleotidyltransferase
MDLQHPLRLITPTLDGDVLALLAAGEVRLTGRQIGREIAASQEGVRRVLARLERQGIVLRERAGRAHLYRLNRDHLAAPCIERLAGMRVELMGRLKQAITTWAIPPVGVILFGSTARGDSDEGSDIDLLVVRPGATDPDDPRWRGQLTELQRLAAALTGNDARILEYRDDDLGRHRPAERVVADAAAEGIVLFGSVRRVAARKATR